jgi:plastocyanin
LNARPRRAAGGRRVAACVLVALPGFAFAAQVTVAVRDAQGAAIQDAVVWLDSSPARAGKSAAKPAEIGQVSREFDPFVTVVGTGTRVVFPNHDKVKHHVYSFSPAKSFEIQLYSGTPTEPIVFDKAGVVVIGCNIHDWMLAYVVVLDSPWFAKSTANGRAQLANLPAGRYTLHLWHPYQKAAVAAREIELVNAQASSELSAQLELAPPPLKPRRAAGDSY